LAAGRLIETHHKRTLDLRKGIWGHSKYHQSRLILVVGLIHGRGIISKIKVLHLKIKVYMKT